MQDVKVIGSLESKFESTNRIYDEGGCSPTLSTMQGGNQEPKILQASSVRMVRTEEGKALRKQYENHELQHGFNEYREPELRQDGVTNTLSTVQKDNYVCVAMRGRNPTNPKDRTPGIELEQTLEVNENGTSNCLTSVQKDNLVLERPTQLGFIDNGTGQHQSNTVYGSDSLSPNITTVNGGGTQQIKICESQQIPCKLDKMPDGHLDSMDDNAEVCDIGTETGSTLTARYHKGIGSHKDNMVMVEKVGQISNDGSQYGTVISDNGISANLVAGTHGYANSCISTEYRIRKLTPRECWRLMDFSDEDFEKAAEVNSNTQLYKQAGNSIVVNVLVAILGQLIPGEEEVYKEINK